MKREWEAKHKCLKNTLSLDEHRAGVAKRNGNRRKNTSAKGAKSFDVDREQSERNGK